MRCPECGSNRIYRNGTRTTAEGVVLQRYLCRDCGFRFSDANPYKITRINGHRQLCAILEAKKLVNPQLKNNVVETYAKTPDQGQIVDFLWHLKKQGYSDATITTRVKNFEANEQKRR